VGALVLGAGEAHGLPFSAAVVTTLTPFWVMVTEARARSAWPSASQSHETEKTFAGWLRFRAGRAIELLLFVAAA